MDRLHLNKSSTWTVVKYLKPKRSQIKSAKGTKSGLAQALTLVLAASRVKPIPTTPSAPN